MKSLIITGGNGFVGSAIVNKFLKKKYKVIIATTKKNNKKKSGVIFVNYDFTKRINKKLTKYIKQSGLIIHCASILKPNKKISDSELFNLNITGTNNLIKEAIICKSKIFINISTINLYPNDIKMVITENSKTNPSSLYSLSKLIIEQLCNFYNKKEITKFSNLRISAPYGAPYKVKSVLPNFIEKTFLNEKIQLENKGERGQVFTSIEDIANACELIIKKHQSGTFNITGPETTSMKQLAKKIISLQKDTKSKMVFSKISSARLSKQYRKVSIQKAKRILNYKPMDIDFGLKKMINKMLIKRKI